MSIALLRSSQLLQQPPLAGQHLDWSAFIADIDHLVMGRGTYQKVLSFDHWPYADLQVVVLSTTLSSTADERITVARSVEEATKLLIRRGSTVRVREGFAEVLQIRCLLVEMENACHARALAGHVRCSHDVRTPGRHPLS